MKIKDYQLAVAILRCLEHSEREFGKEYSTSTTRVKKNDLVDLATYVKESNQNGLHKCENKKVAHAGPNNDTEVKNYSGGEDKVCCRLQAQKQTTVPPKQYRSSNKNGKHRNAKRRRKAEIARNRTHNKRTCLYVLTQDKKAEAKEGGYRKPANDTKTNKIELLYLHTRKQPRSTEFTFSHKSPRPPKVSEQ